MKVNEKWEYAIDRLVDDLAKPIFVLRMARPFEHNDTSRGKSARTRARNARIEIGRIVREFYASE